MVVGSEVGRSRDRVGMDLRRTREMWRGTDVLERCLDYPVAVGWTGRRLHGVRVPSVWGPTFLVGLPFLLEYRVSRAKSVSFVRALR